MDESRSLPPLPDLDVWLSPGQADSLLAALPSTIDYESDTEDLRRAIVRWWARRNYGRGIGKYSEVLYRAVRSLEGRLLREHDVAEAWAHDFADVIMGRDGAELRQMCLDYPVRATVMCGALEQALVRGSSWGARSSVHDALAARVTIINEVVAPLARAALVDRSHTSDPVMAQYAVTVLLFIGMADDLTHVPPIETLKVPGANLLSEEQVRRLASLKGLAHLELVGLSHEGANGLTALRRLPLHTVNLCAGHVFNAHLSFVAGSLTIRSLDLRSTLVNDDAIEWLARTNLESLDVAGARMTADGVTALRSLFPLARIAS
jgi:hypothetical protein